MDKQEKGKLGEVLASQYLRESGYLILTSRYRTKRGELDIIALKGDCIFGFEVKYVSNLEDDYHPIHKMNPKKLNVMKYVMQTFVSINNQYSSHQQSFSLITVDGKSKVELYSDLYI